MHTRKHNNRKPGHALQTVANAKKKKAAKTPVGILIVINVRTYLNKTADLHSPRVLTRLLHTLNTISVRSKVRTNWVNAQNVAVHGDMLNDRAAEQSMEWGGAVRYTNLQRV